jgi:peptidoglycan/LPS O-acetylase OafA/YrhL
MTSSDSSNFDISSPKREPLRLHFLDGLRGLTALYIVLVHIYREIDANFQGDGLPASLYWSTRWLTHGRNAVSIFIVLSGYCLMLPVIRSQAQRLRGGILQYLKRRARRILPPYYIAIALLLLLALLPASVQHLMGVNWNEAQPAWSLSAIASHLLLVHNLSLDTIFKIEIPMWSIATEWQIYFFFPLLLLIWRNFGMVITVIVAFAIGFAPHFLSSHPMDLAIPWFLGLFALGMAAAALNFSEKPNWVTFRQRLPWRWIAVGCVVLLTAVYWRRPSIDFDFKYVVLSDLLVGLFAVSLIVDCTSYLTTSAEAQTKRQPSAILNLLEMRWVLWLGTFSYSLYLIHMPVLALLQIPINLLHLSISTRFFVSLLVVLPASIVAAYGFYFLFEKPFLSQPKAVSNLSLNAMNAVATRNPRYK